MPARTLILLFCAGLAAHTLVFGGTGWNALSRFALTTAIVHDGSVSIDAFAPFTGDKALHGGHYYSDKAPGVSFLAVVPTAIANAITKANGSPTELVLPNDDGTTRLTEHTWWLIKIATATVGLISAIAVVAFCDLLCLLGARRGTAVLFAVIYGFGTTQWGWSTLLFGHATAGALLVIALWALTRATAAPRISIWLATLGGFCLGMAIITEFPVAPAATFIALFGIWRGLAGHRPGMAPASLAAAAASIPPLLLLAAYNAAAFGAPFNIGYASLAPGFEGMRTGFFGIAEPSLLRLWLITLGQNRGIVWLSPILILMPLAVIVIARREMAVALLCVAVVASFLFINAGYVYWNGGGSTGARHIVPALAFAIIPIALAYDHIPRIGQLAVVALAGLGICINFVAVTTDMLMEPTDVHLWSFLVSNFGQPENDRVVLFWQEEWSCLSIALYGAIVALLLAAVWLSHLWSGQRPDRGRKPSATETPTPGTT